MFKEVNNVANMAGHNTLRQRRSPGNTDNNLQRTSFDKNNRNSKVVGSIGIGNFPSDELKHSRKYYENDSRDEEGDSNSRKSSPLMLRLTTSNNDSKINDLSSNSAFAEASTIRHGNSNYKQNPFRQSASTEPYGSECFDDSQRKQSGSRMNRTPTTPSGVANDYNNRFNEPRQYSHNEIGARSSALSLGFLSFGSSLLVFMIHITYDLSSSTRSDHDEIIVSCSMLIGGFLQLLSGVNENRPNNLFYFTSFCFYGGISLIIGAYYVVAMLLSESKSVVTPSPSLLRVVCILIAIITILFFTMTFNLNKTISVLYFALILSCTFFTATISNDAAQEINEVFRFIGGYLGMVAAVISIWLSFVELLNENYGGGKELVVLGQWKDSRRIKAVTGQGQPFSIGQRTPQENEGIDTSERIFFNTSPDSSGEEIFFNNADVETANGSAASGTLNLPTRLGSNDDIRIPALNTSGDQMRLSAGSNLKDAVSSYVAYSSGHSPTSGNLLKRLSGSPRRPSPTSRSLMDYQTKNRYSTASNLTETRTHLRRLPLAPNLKATDTSPSISSATSTSSDYTESLAISLATKPFRVTQF